MDLAWLNELVVAVECTALTVTADAATVTTVDAMPLDGAAVPTTVDLVLGGLAACILACNCDQLLPAEVGMGTARSLPG